MTSASKSDQEKIDKKLIIEALNSTHDRSSFTCGIDALDSYLQKQANQDIKRRVSRIFVATHPDRPNSIMGYYSLSSLSIDLNHLPESLARKLPKHPIPAALIGRLAVSKLAQGKGIGNMLLVDALKRTLAVSHDIAIYALVVDAINQEAELFYQSFGFTHLSIESSRLFLPLRSI